MADPFTDTAREALKARILAPIASGDWGHIGSVGRLYGKPGARIVREEVAAGRLEQRGLKRGREYRIATPALTDARSLRQTILDVIGERGVTGSVSLTEEVRKRLGRAISLHDVQHILGAIQRNGLISFAESKTGPTHKTYTNIRLTRHADGGIVKAARVAIGGTVKASHVEGDVRVIDDIALTHVSVVAQEEEPVPATTSAGDAPPAPEPTPEPEVATPAAPDPWTDGFTAMAEKTAAMAVVAEVQAERDREPGFPILARLMHRRSLVDAAAAALAEAGLEDEAIRVLDLTPPTTDVEEEYLRFVRTVRDQRREGAAE